MAATKEEIRHWFKEGVKVGRTRMIIICDSFDHEDYPVYVRPGENAHDVADKECSTYGRVMEVYDLTQPMEPQIEARRVFNW